ncbi:MAG: rhomboid family intramembrane serine protease [Bacteroidetes bacterium]|jgi:membrane associated rhomboid family serine protease|nr:MAG: rhomboid family intramembrane serine protease [Bacteroidota bacterium]
MSLSFYLEAPVSLAILLVTIGVSIWGLLDEDMRDKQVLVPYDTLMYKEYWRILSSGFVHGNVMHLVLNMTTLFFFSFIVEHRLGHWQFALLYFLGLLLSNGATLLRYRDDTAYEGSVGASGAISAVVLSAVLLNPYIRFGLPFLSERYPWLFLPGYIVAAAYLVYSLVNTFLPSKLNVNHLAHLSGALAGIGITFLVKPGLAEMLERFVRNM